VSSHLKIHLDYRNGATLSDTTDLKIHEHLPPGISLVSADDLKEWKMDIKVLDDNPLYLNKTYRLQFKFSNNYPIGTSTPPPPPPRPPLPPLSNPSPTPLIPPTTNPPLLTNSLSHRSTRSNLPKNARPAHTHTPTHLLQRDHLPRSAGQPGLESGAERRERLYEYPEYVDGQHEERETAGGRGLCEEEYAEAERYSVLLR